MDTQWIAFVVLATALIAHGAPREFTEKSGGRTLKGEVTNYDAERGTVTLRLKDNRNVTFDPTFLSDKDVEYIERWGRNQALASQIDISANRESGDRISPEIRGSYQWRYDESGFRVSLRNRATSGALSKVSVKWHVVVTRRGQNTEVVTGRHVFESIGANETVEFSTDKVRTTTACRSRSSCPACVRYAANFTPDRLEGVLVEILDADGEVVSDLVAPSSRERRIREAIEPESASADKRS